jgi:DNA-binding CsgD family transcriptional regulator
VAATRVAAAERLKGADNDVRRPALTVMRGWVAARQGDLAAAMKAFDTVVSGATKTCNYWPLWPCWIGLFFVIGTTAADPTFTDIVVQEAELAAERNPGVASFEGLALNVRGRATGDLPMITRAAAVLARSPRPLLRAFGAESLGQALLAQGDRTAALTQLDQAWDDYHQIGARNYRANVQRAMSEAGARRRAKCATAAARPSSGWGALTDAERRVAALIAAGHTNRTAAAELGLSVNTISTHLRLVFTKLGIQSRVQLANTINAEGQLAQD